MVSIGDWWNILPVYFTFWHFIIYHVAIENTPFIIDLPIQNGDFL